MDAPETPFERQSRELIEAAQKVLAKKKDFRNPDELVEAIRVADIKRLQGEWTAKYNSMKDSLTDTEQDIALQVRDTLRELLGESTSLRANGGRRRKTARRKYSRRYCKKTPCRRMGFTQRASCRPYKNCYRSTRS